MDAKIEELKGHKNAKHASACTFVCALIFNLFLVAVFGIYTFNNPDHEVLPMNKDGGKIYSCYAVDF